MSDTTSTGISRRQLLEAAGTATAAAAIGLAGLKAAQAADDPAKEMVPFQATVKGPFPPAVLIPSEPPIGSGRSVLNGDSPLLGAVAYVDHHEARAGVDGNPVFATGECVVTAANGDAAFIDWVMMLRPPSSTGVIEGTGAFALTGGRGRFRGAGGSGSMAFRADGPANEVTHSFDGTVALIK
jgi:hypothetical protein